MKKELLSITAAALFVVTGCQGNNNEQGQGTTNPNINPVNYRNQNNDDYNRNYTLQRDLEERNNLDTRGINNVNYRNDNDNNNVTDNQNRYDVAEEAANRIVDKIDFIDNAYVITTDNNAYVAAELDTDNNNNLSDHGGTLTDDVKNQISTIVKSVDNDIDNVYVSTNPDFFNLTNNYVDDVDNGQPVEGFFDQMGNMIERIFPQNK